MALRKVAAKSSTKAASKIKVPAAIAKPLIKKVATKSAGTSSAVKTKAMTKKEAAPAVTVTIKHLAAEIGEFHNLPKREADFLVVDLFDRLVTHLKLGNKLRIAGLGVMEIKHRAARMGRNPATGETIKIAASKKIAFRPSKDLKESI